jgi:UDP-2,3-diacylglucosamine pyrophosphatase LpxH
MKRRDFLKSMAIAGAAASMTGGMGMMPPFLAPRTAHAAGRNKLIFISDIHMNVDGPYSWLVNHAAYLADFLKQVNSRDDVAELVILGDMLDDWVSPVKYSPQTFADILGASNNAEVVPALQNVSTNPNIAVAYVTGNHDMLSFESQNKEVIANAFPGMTILSDSPGLGAYTRDNVIWAEHGHRYCMFNAPDTWSRSNGHLSLGYFISRLAANRSLSSGEVITTPELIDRFVKSPTLINEYLREGDYDEVAGYEANDAYIRLAFDAMAIFCKCTPWSTFTMEGLDNYTPDPSVDQVGFTYNLVYSGWPLRQDIVDSFSALFNELGHLSDAANLLFEMPESIKELYPFTPRIVLFGHTHQAAFQYHSGEVETIYANTGTWVDNTPTMSWVEIEIQDVAVGQRQYTVSLWFYGESSPKQSATVTVQLNQADYMIRHR